MRELKTEIQISTKPERVWNILMDLQGWPAWNPIVTKIEGTREIGAELAITMCDEKGNGGMRYKSIITALDEKKRFGFVGVMMSKFMFSAERIIELEELSGGTRLVQQEIYTGILAPLFWGKLNARALPMLKSMNEALKKKAENQP
jgi:hypothetical protein